MEDFGCGPDGAAGPWLAARVAGCPAHRPRMLCQRGPRGQLGRGAAADRGVEGREGGPHQGSWARWRSPASGQEPRGLDFVLGGLVSNSRSCFLEKGVGRAECLILPTPEQTGGGTGTVTLGPLTPGPGARATFRAEAGGSAVCGPVRSGALCSASGLEGLEVSGTKLGTLSQRDRWLRVKPRATGTGWLVEVDRVTSWESLRH